jgi:hypothetical protein
MQSSLRTLSALLLAVAACGDATGSGNGRVALRFGTVAPGASRASVQDGDVAQSVQLLDEIVTVGTNGALRIDDIQLIVSEVELKRAENDDCRKNDDDDDDDGDDDDNEGENGERGNACRKFEGGPFLVDLPLGGGVVTLLQEEIPAGTFRAVEFEIDDFEMDKDDEDNERERASELLARLRLLYPEAPARANMIVRGVFTPTDGAPRPFTVYFNADLTIKQRFEEPLNVDEGGGITVRIDPAKWFEIGNRVRDLSALNGRLVEFEAEMRNGFVRVDCDR